MFFEACCPLVALVLLSVHSVGGLPSSRTARVRSGPGGAGPREDPRDRAAGARSRRTPTRPRRNRTCPAGEAGAVARTVPGPGPGEQPATEGQPDQPDHRRGTTEPGRGEVRIGLLRQRQPRQDGQPFGEVGSGRRSLWFPPSARPRASTAQVDTGVRGAAANRRHRDLRPGRYADQGSERDRTGRSILPTRTRLSVSISQPLLRNAGQWVNTYSIRIAAYNRDIVERPHEARHHHGPGRDRSCLLASLCRPTGA